MIDLPAEPAAYHAEPVTPGQASDVEQVKERAQSYLRARGLLEGAPSLTNQPSLEALAIAMERHCGLVPGSVVKVRGDTLSIDRARLDEAGREPSSCLMAVVWLSGVAKVSFVGGTIRSE